MVPDEIRNAEMPSTKAGTWPAGDRTGRGERQREREARKRGSAAAAKAAGSMRRMDRSKKRAATAVAHVRPGRTAAEARGTE